MEPDPKQLEKAFSDTYDEGGLSALELFEQYHRWWRRPKNTLNLVRMAIVSNRVSRTRE